MEFQLIKKIEGLDLTKKVFETDDLPQSDEHEAQIEHFRTVLEDRNLEIFEVKGHQFITEDGVYTIMRNDEIEYGFDQDEK